MILQLTTCISLPLPPPPSPSNLPSMCSYNHVDFMSICLSEWIHTFTCYGWRERGGLDNLVYDSYTHCRNIFKLYKNELVQSLYIMSPTPTISCVIHDQLSYFILHFLNGVMLSQISPPASCVCIMKIGLSVFTLNISQ